MNSLFLRCSSQLLVALLLIFSLFLLWRGHNVPGGGFLGGLVAAAAFVLSMAAKGTTAVLKMVRIDPRMIAAVGVAVALAAGFVPLLTGEPFLTGVWLPDLPIGTPLLFDVGVYLVVVGAVLTVVLTLEQEDGN